MATFEHLPFEIRLYIFRIKSKIEFCARISAFDSVFQKSQNTWEKEHTVDRLCQRSIMRQKRQCPIGVKWECEVYDDFANYYKVLIVFDCTNRMYRRQKGFGRRTVWAQHMLVSRAWVEFGGYIEEDHHVCETKRFIDTSEL